MESAQLIALGLALFVSLMVVFAAVLTTKHRQSAQNSARDRRMAEHKLNARLLHLNL